MNFAKEYNEGEIRFAPTYKYIKDTDTFATGKINRIPSWTDRIL